MPTEGTEYDRHAGLLPPEEHERIEQEIERQIDRDEEARRGSPDWRAKKDEIMRKVNRALRDCAPEKYAALRLALTDWQVGRISREEMEAAIVLWQRTQPALVGKHATPHGYIEVKE